jgi:hypothetical protein
LRVGYVDERKNPMTQLTVMGFYSSRRMPAPVGA